MTKPPSLVSVTGSAVTPAAQRHQQALLAREVDRVPHIRNPTAARHQCRAPIDVAVPDPAGVLIAGIADADQLTPEHSTQGGHRLGVHLWGQFSARPADRCHVPSSESPARRGGLIARVIQPADS